MRLRSFYYHHVISLLVLFAIFVSVYQPPGLTLHAYEAGTQGVEKLSVNNHRPIAEAVKLLQNKYGLIITYEILGLFTKPTSWMRRIHNIVKSILAGTGRSLRKVGILKSTMLYRR